MKRLLVLITAAAMLGLTACDSKEETPEMTQQNAPGGQHAVKVLESQNASNYTYMHVEENGKDFWIAVPQMEVQEGEILYYTKSMEMKDFSSQTLGRTFDVIYFVDGVTRSGDQEKLTMAHSQALASQKMELDIKPAEGGKTIEQIYSQKESLAGKTVKVRGKVTKFNSGILDRNWIHIQDGTGSENNYDLMVTSLDETAVGKTITAEGVIAVNKDFGSGYTYVVMLENAKVVNE